MIHGIKIDRKGRCVHYSSSLDIVSIQFPCCQKFYACRKCHDALEKHEAKRWGEEAIDRPIILCGHCQKILTLQAYLTCQNGCPKCLSPFNPKCQNHNSLYFSLERISSTDESML